MGIGLLDAGSPAHELAREASSLLRLDLVELACRGDAESIRATEIAQPLLLLQSVAILDRLPEETRTAATGVAGHSLGEYTGLVATGALGWREALVLVRERGLAMAAAASPGQGMYAVLAMDGSRVAEVLAEVGRDDVVVANINAPGQVVLSGALEGLDAAAEALRAAGARKVIPLTVGGAFHSPLMRPAAERLDAALSAAPLRDGATPQAFNVDGELRTNAEEIRAALRAQLTASVRWTDCVQTLVASGCDTFLEVGAGTTLSAMGKRIAPGARWLAAGDAEAAGAVPLTS